MHNHSRGDQWGPVDSCIIILRLWTDKTLRSTSEQRKINTDSTFHPPCNYTCLFREDSFIPWSRSSCFILCTLVHRHDPSCPIFLDDVRPYEAIPQLHESWFITIDCPDISHFDSPTLVLSFRGDS